ncbi:MAG: hypothetical protein DSZ27_00890 [Thiomicrospira sp.]|jgi:hypothetical protein|nr:MAG: hypothetical protein DSZ27_00890 [Thiomicrospira sp.]
MDVQIVNDIWTLLASVLGTMVTILVLTHQSKKSRMEMVIKLEDELEKDHKHSAMELFRLLHGIRMNYEQVKELIANNKSIHIIHVLKKSPGMVQYNDGTLEYTPRFKPKPIQILLKYYNQFSMYLYGIGVIAVLVIILISDIKNISGAVITLIALLVFFIFSYKEWRFDKMVDGLIDEKT